MENIQGFETVRERETRLNLQLDKTFWNRKGVKTYTPLNKASLLKARVIRRKFKRNKVRKASTKWSRELGRQLRITLETEKAIASIKFLYC